MIELNEIKLEDYEDDDIFDVVAKLEKSFAIKFTKDAFFNVKTFGDLCDVIEGHIKYDNKDDCTKQQAFYRIRSAISETQQIDKTLIDLNSKLIELFPRQNRRRQVNEFQEKLGVDLKFLTYPGWLAFALIIGVLCSLISFFFDWKVAISGITSFTLALMIADKLGKNLKIDTVRELAELATREHYVEIRRSRLTVNRNEVIGAIKESFSAELSLDKEYLTRDAKFSWALKVANATI